VPHDPNQPSDHVDVAIVGAGFGGLGMAIRLKQQQPDTSFTILERAPDVGGTWFANTYPGCQCDVPSNLYSFSFAPKHDWTHTYPEQPQILDYLRECVTRFGIEKSIRLNTELEEAAWDANERHWRIATSKGALTARILIAAPGLLSEPSLPLIPGLDSFGGTLFHSARWNHEHDLTGERVALLGTGATAVQIAPRIQPQAERLSVFQRTPPWILPHPDREVKDRQKRLYGAAPILQKLSRAAVYTLREGYVLGMVVETRILKLFETVAKVHMRRQVKDKQLRQRLTPKYAIGCKRILLSDDWYPTITAPNAELVTDRIDRVEGNAIVTKDGRTREVDTIILATGFSPTDPPIARRLKDATGRTLSDTWRGSPQAYLGTTVAGFPNLFLLYGPNLNLGHSSIVYMLESQIAYVLDALKTMRARRLTEVEVKPDVQDAWNDRLQERLEGTVWDTGGCSSWYLDANGRDSVMWPDFTFKYRRRVRRFDPSDYRLEPASA
jgi:cation diffusion facilitator CzcD-associated flavoprotein CzcO